MEQKYQTLQDEKKFKTTISSSEKYESIQAFSIAACPEEEKSQKTSLGCDLVFCSQDNKQFIYRDIWRLHEQFTANEINLYILRIQYVQSVVNECSYDLCIALLVSVVAIGVQYIWSSVLAMSIPSGDLQAIYRSSEMKANMTS